MSSTEDSIISLKSDVGYIRGRFDGLKDDIVDIKDGQKDVLNAFNTHVASSNEVHTNILRRQDKMEMKVAAVAGAAVLIAREAFEWIIRHLS